MSELDVWGPHEEQVVRDERMWLIRGWMERARRAIAWLQVQGEVKWETWSESTRMEFVMLVRRCAAQHREMRRVDEGREDWMCGFGVTEARGGHIRGGRGRGGE